jgi:hypothetical protein
METTLDRWKRVGLALTALAVLAAAGTGVSADEGMWLYDRIPAKELLDRYGFAPSQRWLDHLRLSSVNMYASASFVSPDGLILTNHHVALGSIQRMSTAEHNYVRDGFYAKTRAEELPIPGLTVRVLNSIEDVTSRVESSVKPGATVSQASHARRKVIAAIEAECFKKTGDRGEVVTFFGGARYSLYRYKPYTDVRLVMAPELQAASFGGDSDNFTYPRYDYDVSFLRAYENGRPARVEHYLLTDPEGAKDGELVFVSGHPGETDRQLTTHALEYLRDVSYPAKLERINRQKALLAAYSARGPEEARRAKMGLYFLDNSRKSLEGELGGLEDPSLMSAKQAEEKALRDAVAKDPEMQKAYGGAWETARKAQEWARAHQKEIQYKSDIPGAGWGRLMSAALTLVKYAQEARKPDLERLPGFHEAELEETLRSLQSPRPYFKDMEEVLLADALDQAARTLGPEDPYVETLLAGQAPEARARQLLSDTRLDDVAVRKALVADKGKAVAASMDPLLEFVRQAYPTIRETETLVEENLDAPLAEALTLLAKARFAAYGDLAYPDATGTLRLSFGKVAGYPQGTTRVPPFTTFYGLYDRAYSFGNAGDYQLTQAQEKHRDELALATPYNLVCTADITGGNSGSPLVDREGRLVGLVFDGNEQSHPNAFLYRESQARCVAVDIRGILEGLRKIYGAGALADEMLQLQAGK